MATLVANQAAFLAQQQEMARQQQEFAKRFAQIDERFNRIEAILLEHSRILEELPDAVRKKFGFRTEGQDQE
jgi:hypothetical protein